MLRNSMNTAHVKASKARDKGYIIELEKALVISKRKTADNIITKPAKS